MLASAWSRQHDRCVNCGVDTYAHKARGYCVQCYPIAQRVRVIKAWRPGQPVPHEMRGDLISDDEILSRLRQAWVKEYRRRLARLQWFEEEPKDVSGLDIEHLVNEVAQHMQPRIRRNPQPHYGIASRINSDFGLAERRALHRLFVEMLHGLRWKPSLAAIYREAFATDQKGG